MRSSNPILSIKIKNFERELAEVKNRGYIHEITFVKAHRDIYGGTEIIGAEILFLDHVSDKQINKIQTYIERQYNFIVVNSLIEVGKLPKILLVQYGERAI